MHQLVYVSSAVSPFTPEDLAKLLAAARESNRALGVTGALLYNDGNFFQVLEGPREGVEAIYAKICKDPRHRGILRLLAQPVEQRDFPDWAMGWLERPGRSLEGVPAKREWQTMARVVREGKARRLLEVFSTTHRR